MLGEIVEHARFGQGTVTAFEPPRMEVTFDAEPDLPRRFSYPAAIYRFITFVNPEADNRARQDLSESDALQRQQALERIEAGRRREELITGLRLEAMRKKRSDAAKKAAERRRVALAARKTEAE